MRNSPSPPALPFHFLPAFASFAVPAHLSALMHQPETAFVPWLVCPQPSPLSCLHSNYSCVMMLLFKQCPIIAFITVDKFPGNLCHTSCGPKGRRRPSAAVMLPVIQRGEKVGCMDIEWRKRQAVSDVRLAVCANRRKL